MSDPLGAASQAATSPGQNEFKYWQDQIDGARKRDKNWRKDAREVTDLYESVKERANSFNILYSNTETLMPAVYNQLPRPQVRRRYEDDDPIGKAVSDVTQRALEYTLDTPDPQYTSCDELFSSAVLAALVPGRGMSRFRYDPEMAMGKPAPVSAGSNEEPADQSDETPSQEVATGVEPVDVKYEAVCGINVQFDRVLMGFAKRWSDVPWIAYEHRMTQADVKKNFGASWVEKLTFDDVERNEDKADQDPDTMEGMPKAAVVYEVWHKSKKRVVFMAPSYKEGIIKRVVDPLGIPGFYDCPKPMQFASRNGNLTPITLYSFYKEQAKELNRISQRINKIIDAIKVRGFYNSAITSLQNLMTMDENTIQPTEETIALMDGKGLDSQIWLMPLEKLIQVLQQLYQQREACKQVIYEITGISDIIRGATVASETATAQQIKNQWGTLRLKRMQKEVQRYIRDCLRIMTAIMAEKFDQKTWAQITELDFPTAQQQQQAKQTLQEMQTQMQQAQLAMQQVQGQQQQTPPPQPGQPPQAAPAPAAPAGPDPQAMQQQMQQMQQQAQPLMQMVQSVNWDDILKVLKDDMQRGYKIDIETNSTVDPDATEDKQNITDLLTAVGQVLQTFGPLAQEGAMPLGAIKEILITICRRFQFGPNVEDALKKIPDDAPQQQGPSPEDQAKMQIMQMDLQLKQKETEGKMQLMDKEMQVKQAELAIKEQELQLKREELQIKQAEMGQKRALSDMMGQQKLEAAQATHAAKMQQIRTQQMAAAAAPAPGVQ